jgi:hypothetical protein
MKLPPGGPRRSPPPIDRGNRPQQAKGPRSSRNDLCLRASPHAATDRAARASVYTRIARGLEQLTERKSVEHSGQRPSSAPAATAKASLSPTAPAGKRFVIAASRTTCHYTSSLYKSIGPWSEVHMPPVNPHEPIDRERVMQFLEQNKVKVFHLHWPEHFLGTDIGKHRLFMDCLQSANIPIVWTQHNLIPHNKDPVFERIYGLWASTAAAAIHHSRWGLEQILQRYEFADDALHVVIPHAHTAFSVPDLSGFDRASCEQELGLGPCALRVGIIGGPRRERQTSMAMQAFAASSREDIQLAVFSLGPDDRVPDDPRIHAQQYEFASPETHYKRLLLFDALLLPFAPAGMLTTGTFFDAVTFGLPVIVSDWPFLAEMTGDAGIHYGSTQEDLTALFNRITKAEIAAAAAVMAQRRDALAPERLAPRLLSLIERVVQRPSS